jgi:cytochrome c peroxidase
MKLIAMMPLILPMAAGAVDFVDNDAPDPLKVELGKMLFHDKELSGNRNTTCATCHHALTDTGDGLSLPVGEGGLGLGVTRDTGTGIDAIHERVPRNAPPVFMLGSTEVTRLFHDGRIEVDPSYPSGFKSPAGHDLPEGLDNIVAVQAMFPVTSATEMAGQPGENEIAAAAAIGPVGVWEALAVRLRDIPEYVDLFIGAFEDINGASEITYAHAANAIAAFEIDAWRADKSPWDAYQAGNSSALNQMEKKGMQLFFGKAGCSACHSGEIFSDMEFHAIAMPQIGPGKGDGFDYHDDFGRYRETGNPDDMYAFRTPPLRNVALTAPYGHAGAYDTLEAVVRHHLNPEDALWAYHYNDDCRSRPVMPSRSDLDAIDCAVMDNPERVQAIADAAAGYQPVSLTDHEVNKLLAFLHALTDKSTIDLREDVPSSVPSGSSLAE